RVGAGGGFAPRAADINASSGGKRAGGISTGKSAEVRCCREYPIERVRNNSCRHFGAETGGATGRRAHRRSRPRARGACAAASAAWPPRNRRQTLDHGSKVALREGQGSYAQRSPPTGRSNLP